MSSNYFDIDDFFLKFNSHGDIKFQLNKDRGRRKQLYSNLSYDARVKVANQHDSIYQFWKVLIARCYDRNHFQYKYWGNLGFQVIDDWRYNQLNGFMNFIIDVGILDYRSYSLKMLDTQMMINNDSVVWEARMSRNDGLSNREVDVLKNTQFKEREDIIIEQLGFSDIIF